MKGNLVTEILCTDVDVVRTVQFLRDVVQDVVNSGLIPEMTQDNYEWYVHVLVQELDGVNILVHRDEADASNYAACAFTSGDTDHHVLGYGLTAQTTFSTCSVCLKGLLGSLKSLAKDLGMSWIKLQHRTGVHTYRTKLYTLRRP